MKRFSYANVSMTEDVLNGSLFVNLLINHQVYSASEKLAKVGNAVTPIFESLATTLKHVSIYIADMEIKTTMGRLLVPSWDSDYKNLKHVRWVRNQIAHESDMLQVSETTDLAFVQDFYDRILSEEDPLALFRKAEAHQKPMRVNSQPQSKPSQTPQRSRPVVQPSPAPRYSQPPVQPPRKASRFSSLLAFLMMVLLVLVFFVICLKLNR